MVVVLLREGGWSGRQVMEGLKLWGCSCGAEGGWGRGDRGKGGGRGRADGLGCCESSGNAGQPS